MQVPAADRNILRDLAKRVAEIAGHPAMPRRRQAWIEHNSLRSTYPMILISPEGSWVELLPDSVLRCSGKETRPIEQGLRMRIYAYEHFRHDAMVEKEWCVGKCIKNSGWGLEPRQIPRTEARGSWHIDPVIKEPSDLKKLKYPEITHDEKASQERFDQIQDLFGDLLNVRLVGVPHVSFHLMSIYTKLRGLEEVMVDMYAEPRMLHDAMAFLEEGYRRSVKQYVDLNLLTANNDNTYHSSGGNGYTDELPLPDAHPQHIRPRDMWASAESQELAQVSPEHHAEFVLAYEKRLLEPFGLNGYGCCEDLTRKLKDVFTIPHIRRISISPWADVDICAAQLRGKYIFSWKPNPAHLVGDFNAEAVRKYIRHTVDVARRHGCVLEMILKDTHTCENRPERFDEWTRIAREVVTEVWGPARWNP